MTVGVGCVYTGGVSALGRGRKERVDVSLVFYDECTPSESEGNGEGSDTCPRSATTTTTTTTKRTTFTLFGSSCLYQKETRRNRL